MAEPAGPLIHGPVERPIGWVDQPPFIGFGQDDYVPEEPTPDYLLPGTRGTWNNAAHRLWRAGRGYLPSPRTALAQGALAAADLFGYGPEARAVGLHTEYAPYALGLAATGATAYWRFMNDWLKSQPNYYSVKYPTVLGRTNFTNSTRPGNGQTLPPS